MRTSLHLAGSLLLAAMISLCACTRQSGPAVGKEAAAPAAPWVHTFTPLRQVYVSPDGTGSGESTAKPAPLAQAVKNSTAGDLIWLAGGRYDVGTMVLAGKGTRQQPIVYRAMPGQRITINGRFNINGPYNWVWGMEITGLDGKWLDVDACTANAPGVHLINNIIHDTQTCNGIGGWRRGPDHVYYGNILFKIAAGAPKGRRGYPTYTQNHWEEDGYKYFVQNMFLDTRKDSTGQPYNVHAYTEGGYLSGFYFRQDIISRGRFLLGGGKEPHHHNTVEQCVFYDAPEVQFGWSRPVQVTFRDNYLACSFLDYWMYWTYGPADFGGMVKPLPNVVTGNTIVLPPKTLHAATVDANMNPDAVQAAGLGVLVRTSYQGDAPTNLGEQSLDAADTFDNNLYLGIFRGLLYAGGKLGEYDLPGWRKATAAAGKEFDAGSKQAPMPTVPAVFVFANEYEPGRANVAVINWTKAATVKVDLSAALRRGAAFRMVKARDPYGPSVAEGVYKGPVSVPMEEEFAAFLVLPGR